MDFNDSNHLLNKTNIFGQNPLYLACKNGNMEVVRFLINNKADPFIKSEVAKYKLDF